MPYISRPPVNEEVCVSMPAEVAAGEFFVDPHAQGFFELRGIPIPALSTVSTQIMREADKVDGSESKEMTQIE